MGHSSPRTPAKCIIRGMTFIRGLFSIMTAAFFAGSEGEEFGLVRRSVVEVFTFSITSSTYASCVPDMASVAASSSVVSSEVFSAALVVFSAGMGMQYAGQASAADVDDVIVAGRFGDEGIYEDIALYAVWTLFPGKESLVV